MASEQKTCFLLSPIGRVGTETHTRFKEVLDYVIRPAIESSGHVLQVLRADEIQCPGSFIKDILEHVLESHIVIADLTSQNPNVFYELGVRHALSPRTILVAQTVDDIPSDLREYRAIVYDVSAKGAADFRERLHEFLKDIAATPNRPDNPVLDRLGSIIEARTASLQEEVASLRKQLSSSLRGDAKAQPGEAKATRQSEPIPRKEGVPSRLARILMLSGAGQQFLAGDIVYGKGKTATTARLPAEQGDFKLHFVIRGGTILACWYIAIAPRVDADRLIADMRVLLGRIPNSLHTQCLFIVASTDVDSSFGKRLSQAFGSLKKFVPAKKRALFSFEVWDDARLSSIELDLGLKIPPPKKTQPKKHM